MKIGLKLWSTNDFYMKSAMDLFERKLFNYIELYVVPDSIQHLSDWKQLQIPFVLHAPHSLSGLNPSQKNCKNRNFELIEQIDEYRKSLNPDFVIFHPGLNGNIEETIQQFCKIRESYSGLHEKMIVENKPKIGLNGESCIGSSVNEIVRIMEQVGIGFCLDIGHAICAANSEGIGWGDLLKDFLHLKPKMYHLSDGEIDSAKDHHMNLGAGNYKFQTIFELIPEDSMITIETEKSSKENLDDFEKDLNYIMDQGKNLQ